MSNANSPFTLHLLPVTLRTLRSSSSFSVSLSNDARTLGIKGSMKAHLPARARTSSDAVIDILRETKTIAVVGLSSNPTRPSYVVAQYLQSAGYRIIPVNPNENEILGEKSFAHLEDVPETVDVVDVFRRPEHVPAIAESAIKIAAKTLWLQLGIENSAAAERACAAGLNVIEDACLLVEHKKRRQLLAPKS